MLRIDRVHELLDKKLRDHGFTVDTDLESPPEKLAEIIGDYDGLILRSRVPVNAALLDKAEKLKLIARVGSGLEGVDTAYARQKGIAVINAPEGNRNAVGEMALGLLLALMRNIVKADREIKNGFWNRKENTGFELEGKTVDIIGYGNTGKAFARKLAAFDTEVIFYDILPGLSDAYGRQTDYDEIFRRADAVSLHVPLTKQTRGMVNKKFIDAFAKPVYLINTSRGEVVITEDVADAIEKGKIRGAALDVIEYENPAFGNMNLQNMPAAFRRLAAHPGVILTPHIAGKTYESERKLAEVTAEKIIRFFE